MSQPVTTVTASITTGAIRCEACGQGVHVLQKLTFDRWTDEVKKMRDAHRPCAERADRVRLAEDLRAAADLIVSGEMSSVQVGRVRAALAGERVRSD